MKLKSVVINCTELQDYLDKYQEKIKFITFFSTYCAELSIGPNQILLVIDEG